MLAAPEAAFDRFQRAQEARIVGTDEAEIEQLKQAGIELVPVEYGGKARFPVNQGAPLDLPLHPVGRIAPEHSAVVQADAVGDPGEPVSPWPKHRRGYEDFGLPPDAEPYDKQTILEYLEFCRRHVAERVPVVNLGWGADEEYTGLELQIYSIRHLMQHCGELMERLGSRTGAEIHWVGQVRD